MKSKVHVGHQERTFSNFPYEVLMTHWVYASSTRTTMDEKIGWFRVLHFVDLILRGDSIIRAYPSFCTAEQSSFPMGNHFFKS